MKRLLLVLALLSLMGCASLSSYQEAKVVPTGEAQVFFGLTGYTDDLPRKMVFDTAKGQGFTLLEAGSRIGVFKNLDVGFKYTFIGAISLDAKYQL